MCEGKYVQLQRRTRIRSRRDLDVNAKSLKYRWKKKIQVGAATGEVPRMFLNGIRGTAPCVVRGNTAKLRGKFSDRPRLFQGPFKVRRPRQELLR